MSASEQAKQGGIGGRRPAVCHGQKAEDADTARLVDRFRAGDREAFAAIYTRYFDRVFAYLRVVLSDPQEAEDLTQQAFVNALAAMPRYRHRKEPFRGWLFVIARNLALSQLRKESWVEPVDPAELNERREASARREALDADETALRALDWITDEDLLSFIERLQIPQRQVLVLRYMLDLPHAEIARMLNLTPDHVRMLQHRAQAFIKDRLVSLGKSPEQPGKPQQAVGRAPHDYVGRSRRFALLR